MKKCLYHPTYKAVREPRGKCVTCWLAWERKVGRLYNAAFFRRERADRALKAASSRLNAVTSKVTVLTDMRTKGAS